MPPGLSDVEHMPVERGHVDRAVLGDVQVVIVLRDPEEVDLLRQVEFAERCALHDDVRDARPPSGCRLRPSPSSASSPAHRSCRSDRPRRSACACSNRRPETARPPPCRASRPRRRSCRPACVPRRCRGRPSVGCCLPRQRRCYPARQRPVQPGKAQAPRRLQNDLHDEFPGCSGYGA